MDDQQQETNNSASTPAQATEQTKKGSFKRFSLMIVILAVLFVGALVYERNKAYFTPTSQLTTPSFDGNVTDRSDEASVSGVAEKVSPSVVSIVTNMTTRSFFGVSQRQAAGTGIIVSADGYILTNKHVVATADSVTVVAADGETYDNVKVVGKDPLNDVAYLKIDGATGLKAATLGDSSTVRVGQSVVAIGNALGQYQNTVTSGIISGLGRPVQAGDASGSSVETLADLLQTDAAINSGNSGGPLLNMAGQVVGINTAVAQDAQGIGFAIPINATKGTLKGVLAGKGVQRAYLGVRYVPLTADMARQYDLPVRQGAYVYAEDGAAAVLKDGPADKAGVRERDIIIKINNLQIGRNGGVSSLIGAYSPGDTVTLTILRDGKEQNISVTLGNFSE